MPYEIAFAKKLQIVDEEQYINECCWGGDAVTEQLLPMISARYEHIQREQEDWGWFIWFRKANVSLSVDVFCDDPVSGSFRIHLTSRRKRFLIIEKIEDGPELEELKQLIVVELEAWAGGNCTVNALDSKYMPAKPDNYADSSR
jgi:hypothetical protein